MAKVIIECTDKQAKSIANSFRNEHRKVIINRMLATDKAELIDKVESDIDYNHATNYSSQPTTTYSINII